VTAAYTTPVLERDADGEIVCVSFRCPAPHSKKNSREGTRPNSVALSEQRALASFLQMTLGRDQPLFDGDDVGVEIDYLPRELACDVRVFRIRPKPAGFTGRRRDLDGLTHVLLDAMQGSIIRNDDQAAEIILRRILPIDQ
jgi:hypothetical protein